MNDNQKDGRVLAWLVRLIGCFFDFIYLAFLKPKQLAMKYVFYFILCLICTGLYAQKTPTPKTSKGNAPAAKKVEEEIKEPALYTNNFSKKLTAEDMLDCGTMTDLEVIVPITSEMKKYERFNINLYRKTSDPGDDFSDFNGALAAVFVGSKEYEIEYADKKELRFVLYNKADPKKESPLFSLNPRNEQINGKRFFEIFCKGNDLFRVSVFGGLKTTRHWDVDYSVMVDDYKYKLLQSTGSFFNSAKPKENQYQLTYNNKDLYLLDIGSGNTFTKKPYNNSPDGGYFTISNGYVFEIFIIEPRESTVKDQVAYKKGDMKPSGSSKQLNIEKEGDNYFIYTIKESKGFGKKKILSTGIYYLVPTSDRYFIRITNESETLTVDDYVQRLEFLKKIAVEKRY